jgi:hypothetical protein
MLHQRPSAVFLILPAYSLIVPPAKSGSNCSTQKRELLPKAGRVLARSSLASNFPFRLVRPAHESYTEAKVPVFSSVDLDRFPIAFEL